MDILPAHHYQFSGFLTALASLSLVVLVHRKAVDKYLRFRFVLYYLSLFVWSLSLFICTSVYNYQLSYFFCQLTHAGAIMIPVFFLHFTFVYLNRMNKIEQIALRVLYGCAIFFLIINLFFRNLFFDDVVPKLSFPYFPNDGILYTPWVVTFVIAVIMAHFVLLRAMLSASGIRKKQIRFFLIANALGYLGGIGCFLPVYDLPYFPFPYGPYGVFLLSLVSGYAILKYRFIDLQFLVKNTIVFASLFAFVIGTFSFMVFIFQNILSKFININPFLISAITAFVIISAYDRLRKFLVDVTDMYLFQKKINYRLLLREASEYLAHVDSLKQQARNIVAFLLKKGRIANASVYAFAAPDKSSLLLKASRPFISDSQLQRINLSHPLIEYFSKHQGPVEINALKEAGEDTAKSQGLDEISALMKSLQAEAAIPCFGGEAVSKFDKKSSRLKGILFLGHQKSDEPYSEEELDVFFTLGQESSIAFENARLYDEAVNRAIELQKMNEELKKTHAALLEEKKRAVLAGLGKSMAHEIRNPITPINSHLYFGRKRMQEMKNMFEANLSKPTEANHQNFLKNFNSAMELLSEIEKSKDRIQGIVNTLYNLVAQKTSHKVEVKLDMVAESAIEEVKYQNYWETLDQPDIKNRIPRQLPFASGIPQDIQGVFVNLIVNALFALQKKTDKKITIDGMVDPDNPDMIKIEFADNGCGMTEEVMKKCFEHGYTTKGAKGTGLGLFYCKNIIEQVHGGTIDVKSKVGEGTCFIIRLPRFKKLVDHV